MKNNFVAFSLDCHISILSCQPSTASSAKNLKLKFNICKYIFYILLCAYSVGSLNTFYYKSVQHTYTITTSHTILSFYVNRRKAEGSNFNFLIPDITQTNEFLFNVALNFNNSLHFIEY